MKVDTILDKLETFKDVFLKNELDKAKLHLKLEINTKTEELQNEFMKKLTTTKKTSEKAITKLKNSHNEEVSGLRSLLKVNKFMLIVFRIYMMK
jgi:hypothetical protein